MGRAEGGTKEEVFSPLRLFENTLIFFPSADGYEIKWDWIVGES